MLIDWGERERDIDWRACPERPIARVMDENGRRQVGAVREGRKEIGGTHMQFEFEQYLFRYLPPIL